MISALRGRCPRPLDECGTTSLRTGPSLARAASDWQTERTASGARRPGRRRPPRRRPSRDGAPRASRGRSAPPRPGVLPHHEPEVRGGREVLVDGAEQVGRAARLGGVDDVVDPGADDEARQCRRAPEVSTATPSIRSRRASPDSRAPSRSSLIFVRSCVVHVRHPLAKLLERAGPAPPLGVVDGGDGAQLVLVRPARQRRGRG